MSSQKVKPQTSEPRDRTTVSSAHEIETHQFGGCNKLLGYYQTIGQELLRYEHSEHRYGGGATTVSAFREGVVFVPLEVLESYLDDLLDLDIKDERLFIVRESGNLYSFYTLVPLAGLLTSIAVGLYAASLGASLFLAFALTVSLALPFAALWHFSPRGARRRMRLAQVVSQEIARRRGHDKDSTTTRTPSFGFGDWFATRSPSSVH